MCMHAPTLLQNTPHEFETCLTYCRGLRFEQTPNHPLLRGFFESLSVRGRIAQVCDWMAGESLEALLTGCSIRVDLFRIFDQSSADDPLTTVEETTKSELGIAAKKLQLRGTRFEGAKAVVDSSTIERWCDEVLGW